jgi:alpha-galactosidase
MRQWRVMVFSGSWFVLAAAGLILARPQGTASPPPAGAGSPLAPLTGHWVSRTPNGDGTFREVVLILDQSGTALAGRVVNPSNEAPISQGAVSGSTFSFVTIGAAPGRSRTAYRGSLANETLTVTIERQGRPPQQLTAVRGSDAAGTAPARIAPPALHEVPDNGLARTPPMGWNSWNYFKGKVDDRTVREIADAMAANGMKRAGYIYVNIDDTWEAGRDSAGHIVPNRKFPDMKALADYVHARGLKLGIYSSPGPATCAGYEGTYAHEADDARTFATWGIDYLKYDWCGASRIYADEDMPAVYQKMADALRVTGRPIVFSLCQYGRQDVWKWGAAAGGNLWRTTGDIADRWESMSNIGFRQDALAPYAKPGHWNDPDMLEVGNGGMSADEYRTHFSLWALLAAPLLAGNDLRHVDADTLSILTNGEVIAVDQDVLGRQGRRVRQDGALEVWGKPLDGGSAAVGLFNLGETPARVTARWQDLGLKGRQRVRDLWAHADAGAFDEEFSATVPRHGVALVRIASDK